jgi:CDP-diacylglycerol pyrophosphatase
MTDRQVSGASRADSDALWSIVHGQCVPNQQTKGDPSPCEVVNLTPNESEGYAVLKDQRGDTHFLLIPTAKISGIEDAILSQPETRNFWASAWDERSRVSARLGKPLARGDIGLAVNSVGSRTQNQLHIHMDCVESDLQESLKENADKIHDDWSFSFSYEGETFRVRKIAQENLDSIDPFKLLAASVAPENMGDHALALLGETFSDGTFGFYLLDGDSSGEIILDRDCDLANTAVKDRGNR